MGRPTVNRAAIDIGTNSTRLLITGTSGEVCRVSRVTGLGRGLARSGRLSRQGREATLRVLAEYRSRMEAEGVASARAVVTAAGRDAVDSGEFLAEVAATLGFAPDLISGEHEARLSYQGAVSDLEAGPWTVVDIGGGSTEIVTADGGVSLPIGSVKLTDRFFSERPVSRERLESAHRAVREVVGRRPPAPGGVIGVAGTWTSLAALELGVYHRVHHFLLDRRSLVAWVRRLATLSIAETERLPGLDPARAPVILGGAVVAAAVTEALAARECLISERDLLDGVVAGMVG